MSGDARIREGMRVVYAGQLPGVVLAVAPEAGQAKVNLDNGTADWFRTDLLVPEGEHDPQEQTPGAWRDRAGFLWLEAREPGSRQVFCYDAPARRRMGDKWPSRPLEEVEAEFGPLDLMVPASHGLTEDRIVFLGSRGRSAEVPPSYARARGWEVPEDGWAEALPGLQVMLLSRGTFWNGGAEAVDGVFVVIRDTRRG